MSNPITLEALRSIPLFAALDDDLAIDLRNRLTSKTASQGAQVFRKGDKGDSMYLVQDGRVAITVNDQLGKELVLAELGQGDFFGEMSLLDGGVRSANARVTREAQLAVLSREQFTDFVGSSPRVALELLSALSERLRRTDELLTSRVSRNLNDEEKARATLGGRAADMLASFGGSWPFIILSIALVVAWVVLNSWILAEGFDPAPYSGLNLVMAIIAGLQAPIIMMSQNRQGEKDRLRADLDYQVNLKNEISLAEVLRRLDVLESERLPTLVAELHSTQLPPQT